MLKNKLTISFLFLLFIIPNVVMIWRGEEHFPFSNNPMFGDYLEVSDSLATIEFEAESNGVKSKVDFSEIGLWEVRTLRYYFTNVYGSSDPNSPQSDFVDQEEFIVRNTLFFEKLSTLIQNKGIPHDKINLLLVYLNQQDKAYSQSVIGTYWVKDGRFELNRNRDE